MRMYYCFILLFISFFSYGADPAFERIINDAKAGNLAPAAFLDNLRDIRANSSMADAFLCRYGGENFEKEPVIKVFSTEIMDNVEKLAQLLGEVYYKKGDANVNDIDSLKFAKSLLKTSSLTSFLGARDVNYSAIFGDALDDMIQDRMRFRDSFSALANHVTNVTNEVVTQEELEEIRALLSEE